MDSWNKEGLLHPNLLVRREEDPEYALLKDLQLSSSDPSHPFQDSVENAPGSIKDFDIIRILHKGPSNSVFLARRIATSHTFAVKVIAKPDMFTKNKMTIIRAKRMAILNQSDSPFVNRIHFAFQSKSKVYLVKELLPQGDCAALISSLGRIGEAVATDYTFQVAQGLEHLHQKGIIHRDLRPENILMDPANRLKLADFGISHKAFLSRNIGVPSEQTINSSQFFRTIYYLTPEAVLGLQDSDPSIDWWALGIITYEFLHGITPYEGGELELVLQKILSGKINWSSSTVPSNAARDFIQDLLHMDPGKRCSFRGAEGVKAHHFLNNRREDIPTTPANISPTSSPE
ncbi:kinase-like domain-containing protein [Mycena galericulata]|nr:kinase-like domain-containing protein [Mycena galericulata]